MISRQDFIKKQIVFCFTNVGEKLSVKNENIVVKDVEGKIRFQLTSYKVFAIFIVGDTSITSNFIKLSKKSGFSIVMMNSMFKVYENLGFRIKGNTLLESKQFSYHSLDVAKFIIQNKILNQAKIIKKLRKTDYEVKSCLKELDNLSKKLKESECIRSIMGVEGYAAKIYFSIVFNDLDWKGRKPRIKNDYLNSSLDIGYTVLFNYIESILNIYGFNTYVGFLHTMFYQRKSLVCDLVEPFRPIIDYQIRKSVNLNQIRKSDFTKTNNKYVLKFSENKKYIKIFAGCINSYREEIFLYIQSFYRSFMKGEDIESFKTFDIK